MLTVVLLLQNCRKEILYVNKISSMMDKFEEHDWQRRVEEYITMVKSIVLKNVKLHTEGNCDIVESRVDKGRTFQGVLLYIPPLITP